MSKYLLSGAAAIGLLAQTGVLSASNVIINGVPQQSGGTVTVPYGHTQMGHHSAGHYGAGHHGAGHHANCCDAYTAAPAVTYETIPAVATEEVVYVDTAPTTVAAPVIYEQPAIEPVIYEQPVVAAPVVTAPVPYAEPARRGWASSVYVGARGGWTAMRDTDFSLQGGTVDNEYDNKGYNVSGVVGWKNQISPNVGYRVEAELGYQSAEIDSHSVGGATFSGGNAFGDTKTLYGFANLYLDVPIVERLNGVVGGGVGAGRVKFDGHGVGPVGVVQDDSDTVFGYHLDAGLSYDVTDRLALEAMYRYTSFVGVDLTAEDGAKSDTDVNSHNVLVGARYGF